MPLKQGRVDLFLERADLSADGGLAESQHLTSMREAARRSDGVENAKLVPIHASLLVPNGLPPGTAQLQVPPCSPCRRPLPPGGKPCPSRPLPRTRLEHWYGSNPARCGYSHRRRDRVVRRKARSPEHDRSRRRSRLRLACAIRRYRDYGASVPSRNADCRYPERRQP